MVLVCKISKYDGTPYEYDDHIIVGNRQVSIRIAIWNINGLSNHLREVEVFLSESHFTNKTHIKTKSYDTIFAKQCRQYVTRRRNRTHKIKH